MALSLSNLECFKSKHFNIPGTKYFVYPLSVHELKEGGKKHTVDNEDN